TTPPRRRELAATRLRLARHLAGQLAAYDVGGAAVPGDAVHRASERERELLCEAGRLAPARAAAAAAVRERRRIRVDVHEAVAEHEHLRPARGTPGPLVLAHLLDGDPLRRVEPLVRGQVEHHR